jgi:hypothetical protein
MYLESTTREQADQPITFDKYDVNGKKRTDVISPVLDLYGSQPANIVDLKNFCFVADGQLIVTPNLIPMSWVRYTFFTCRNYVSNGLNDLGGVPNKKLVNV